MWIFNFNLQRDLLNTTKGKCVHLGFAFYASKLIEIVNAIVIDPFVCSMHFFDTHIAMVYDISCHMAYVIKCQKVPFLKYFWDR